MRTATQSQQQAYNNISTKEQLDSIINHPRVFNALRSIQKRSVKLIEKSYYQTMSLRKDEKEYLFNLYFNFVINKFTYSNKERNNQKMAIIGNKVPVSHIGMRMLGKICSNNTI